MYVGPTAHTDVSEVGSLHAAKGDSSRCDYDHVLWKSSNCPLAFPPYDLHFFIAIFFTFVNISTPADRTKLNKTTYYNIMKNY